MESEDLRLRYNPPHYCLEVARGALMPIYHSPREKLFEKQGHDPLANALTALVSISVIYSYLAIEAFVNYHLCRLWERRHDGTNESQRLLGVLGDTSSFDELKGHKKVRELGERIKVLCLILGYQQLHEKETRLWQDFLNLVNASRHFFVHPTPEPDRFQESMDRVACQTAAGKYVSIAEGILGFFYDQSKKPKPAWVKESTLLRFRGVDLLVGSEPTTNQVSASNPENLRVEYEAALTSAHHHDQLVWTVTSVLLGATLVLLGLVLTALAGNQSQLLLTGVAITGALINVATWRFAALLRGIKLQKYERCNQIEVALGLRQNRDTHYVHGSMRLILRAVMLLLLIVWTGVIWYIWWPQT